MNDTQLKLRRRRRILGGFGLLAASALMLIASSVPAEAGFHRRGRLGFRGGFGYGSFYGPGSYGGFGLRGFGYPYTAYRGNYGLVGFRTPRKIKKPHKWEAWYLGQVETERYGKLSVYDFPVNLGAEIRLVPHGYADGKLVVAGEWLYEKVQTDS